MPEELVVSDGPELSQGSRTINTFVSPSKTFTDILRHSATCWLPLILVALLTAGWAYAIDKNVGFAAVTEQQISKSHSQSEAMQSMEPAARARSISIRSIGTKYVTYCSFIFVFVFMALEALILWGTFNFGLGGNTTYGKTFAVVAFAGLPKMLLWLVSAALLFGGVGTEGFDMQNPAGTNLGYYMTSFPKWAQTLGQFFDVFGLWSLALLILGMAIISRKTVAQSATVIIGWFALIMLVVVAASAVMS